MSSAIPPTPPPAAPSPAGPHSFLERVIGALRLDAATFEEIEHDPGALGQAAGVVVLAGVAAAIGAASQGGGGGGAVGAVFGSLLGWLLGTGFIWVVGVYLLEHTSDYRELLRTLGFASAPQLLLVLRGIPALGALIGLAAFLWGIAAFVVAVRQALDVTTGRAVVVCILAALVNFACMLGLALLFGGGMMMMGGHAGAVGF
jgi:hypothetical protein